MHGVPDLAAAVPEPSASASALATVAVVASIATLRRRR